MRKLKHIVAAAAAAVLAWMPLAANAEYPERPINIIIPYPPGDIEDVLTRIAAKHMTAKFGVPVKVVNKPGGAGVVGATEVAKARPDGYTLITSPIGPVVPQVVLGNTPYKIEDLTPVSIFFSYPATLAVRGDAPYSDIRGLAEYVKKGGKVTLGHFGRGAPPTLLAIGIAEQAGFSFSRDVAFDEVNTLTLANKDADVITATTGTIQGGLQSGEVKAIAAMTTRRIPTLPDVKTVKEQGYSFDVSLWAGLFAPKGTPKAAIDKLARALEEGLETKEAKEYAKTTGAAVDFKSPEESRKVVAETEKIFTALYRKMGLLKEKK